MSVSQAAPTVLPMGLQFSMPGVRLVCMPMPVLRWRLHFSFCFVRCRVNQADKVDQDTLRSEAVQSTDESVDDLMVRHCTYALRNLCCQRDTDLTTASCAPQRQLQALNAAP